MSISRGGQIASVERLMRSLSRKYSAYSAFRRYTRLVLMILGAMLIVAIWQGSTRSRLNRNELLVSAL